MRLRDISRREAIVALIASTVGAGTAWLACQRKPPSDNQTTPPSDNQKKPPSKKNSVDPKVPEKVHNIIVEQLGVDDEEVRYESSFVDDLGADSLDTVELVMAFEEEFKIEVPDEDSEKLTRVGELVEYLRKRKALK